MVAALFFLFAFLAEVLGTAIGFGSSTIFLPIALFFVDCIWGNSLFPPITKNSPICLYTASALFSSMTIGGQAVIEGVMMRNREKFAIAVRLPNGKIKVKKEAHTPFSKLIDVPFLRGVVSLGYMLADGIRALIWSGNQQMGKEEQLGKKEVFGTILFSSILALVFFVGLPFFLAYLLQGEGWLFNLLDGLFRIALFIGYLLGISFMKDVKILFQYHGAEHKTIACYEAKKHLTPENAQHYSRFHPRCGTSFLFIVLLLSIILFSFLSGPLWFRLSGRIFLLPVVASLAYEAIKFSCTRVQNPIIRIFIAPGLWLQRLTTKEPTLKQLEVGIAALQGVLLKNKRF